MRSASIAWILACRKDSVSQGGIEAVEQGALGRRPNQHLRVVTNGATCGDERDPMEPHAAVQ